MTLEVVRPALLAVMALAYAALAIASAADRQAARELTEAPGRTPLSAQASLQTARLALAAGQADEALAAARRGIRAAPIEPAAAALLGSAHFMKGDTSAAHQAFTVARKLGWRDVATQAYWLSAGLALEDAAMAARHLDALMRGAPQLAATRDVLLHLEATAAGRKALAERLRQGPGWLTGYAASTAELSAAAFAVRISLLRDAAMFNRRPACRDISTVVDRLAYRQARYREAYQLWLLACAPDRSAPLANPGFTEVPASRTTPFDWTLPEIGGVSARFEGNALVVRNENPGLPAIAQQTVLLAPGSKVRLTWTAMAENARIPLNQLPALRCPGGANLIGRTGMVRTGAKDWQADFAVPAGCDYQRLELRVPREAGEVRIERVNLAAASPRSAS